MVDAGYSCHDTSFGWVAVKSYTGEYTWEEAKTKCSQDGTNGVKAELPTPRSLIDNDWFYNKANELGLEVYWLGVNDKRKEGTWETQHGVEQNYFNWLDGQPWAPVGIEADCVVTGGNHFNNQWNDDPCHTSHKNLLCVHVESGKRNNKRTTTQFQYTVETHPTPILLRIPTDLYFT